MSLLCVACLSAASLASLTTAQVAKMVLHDWQRGRIPYFVAPPAGAKARALAASNALGVEQVTDFAFFHI